MNSKNQVLIIYRNQVLGNNLINTYAFISLAKLLPKSPNFSFSSLELQFILSHCFLPFFLLISARDNPGPYTQGTHSSCWFFSFLLTPQ